jgi:glycosyltransferase involved in cell wall biosynthesis
MTKKVAFMIRDLNYGGAQRQLITLVKELDKKLFDVTVLCFYSDGLLQKDLNDHGIPVICLEKRDRWHMFSFLWNLFKQLKQLNPDVLHGYLSESNLLTIFFKLFFPSTRIVWGIRDSNISFDSYDWLDRLIFEMECWLSRFVDLVIVNSHAGRTYHLSHGFPDQKMIVIPNGIDTERFKPDRTAGKAIRRAWGISDDKTLIGLIGRLDPMKDHSTFLKAAALLCQERSDVHFVCIGNGPQNYGEELSHLADELGISENILWAGGQSNMPAVYNALDIVCSTSAYGEGFANVIGEAMACEIPCVVTDVGDSAWIVGDTGIVVPANNPEAVKQGLMSVIQRSPTSDNAKTSIRERIVTQFSVSQLCLKTQTAIL